MKKIYFLIILQLVSRQLCGQTNLIPNPSFEEYIQCPSYVSQVSYAKDWFPIRGTADYLHSCASATALIAIPSSQWGYEYPFGAGCTAYFGFSCAGPGDNVNQEWFGCKLNQKLSVGQKYYYSFKLSPGDSMVVISNNAGILLTTNRFPISTYNNIYFPQPFNRSHFSVSNPIAQKNGWTNIFGSLIADSAYNYFAMGNFYDDTLTTYISNPGGRFGNAYYFVDNICFSTDSAFCYNYSYDCLTANISENRPIDDEIKMYPVPSSNFFQISCSNYRIQEAQVFNVYGKSILEKKFDDDIYYIDLTTIPAGYYTVQLRISGQQNLFRKTMLIVR
jgi:hypothetical protein